MGSQAMVGSWESEWNACFIICTSCPSPKTTPGDGRMILKRFAMPTAALGRGDRAQLPLPSPCRLPVALATIHSLPPHPQKPGAQACNGCHSNWNPLIGLAGRVLSPPPGGRGTKPRCRGNL